MLLLKILCLALCLTVQDGKWQRIRTGEGISFLLPNNPQILKDNSNGIASTIYQTKDLSCVAGVVCSYMDPKKWRMDPENVRFLYEELKAGSLDMETAILKNETTVPYEGMLIKEIEYSVVKDKFEMTYFKRFIFRDRYIYQISIGGRTRHMDMIKEKRETFFNSLLFTDPEGKKTAETENAGGFDN